MSVELVSTARRNPRVTSEGGSVDQWINRAGSAVVYEQLNQLIAAGYGYHATVGALTTPVVGGGAGTVIDAEQSEFALLIPSGAAIVPVRISVQLEVAADQDADVTEILVAVDRVLLPTASASTGTATTIFNMRTDNPRTSVCTAISANTSDHNTPTLGLELARKQMVTNLLTAGITQGVMDLVYEPEFPPVIVAPTTGAGLFVYFSGTQATSGFIQVEWVELPSTLGALFGAS